MWRGTGVGRNCFTISSANMMVFNTLVGRMGVGEGKGKGAPGMAWRLGDRWSALLLSANPMVGLKSFTPYIRGCMEHRRGFGGRERG